MAEKVDAIVGDFEPSLLLHLGDEVGREGYLHIGDAPSGEAVGVAVGGGDVAVAASVGPLDAFDHVLAVEGVEVLIDGGVADVFALAVEAIVNFPRGEVRPFFPQQFEDEAALATDAHTEALAAVEGVVKAGDGVHGEGGGSY